MKKIVLIIGVSAILSFNVSESRADVTCPNGTTLNTDCWSCGDNCTAYLTDSTVGNGKKKLNISGTGEMTDWNYYNSAPWYNSRNNIYELEISQGISSFGKYTFSGINNVTSLTIPDSVTSIGWGAFKDMTNVESLTIPGSVTSIGVSAFNNMRKVESLTIPDSVTSVGEGAFAGMNKLTKLMIPDSWGDDGVDLSGLNSRMFYSSCFSGGQPSGEPACMYAKVVCMGNTDNCSKALAKTMNSDNPSCINTSSCTCIGESCLRSFNGGIISSNASQCTGGMYEWNSSANNGNGECQRLGSEKCNNTTKYYFNSVANSGAGQCQRLPMYESSCIGDDLEWNSDSSKCINKNAITASVVDPVTPVVEPEEVSKESGQPTIASCAADGKVLQGNACVSSCGASFKLNDGECDRIRYTPAEAAKWLKDDDNEITITFKK